MNMFLLLLLHNALFIVFIIILQSNKMSGRVKKLLSLSEMGKMLGRKPPYSIYSRSKLLLFPTLCWIYWRRKLVHSERVVFFLFFYRLLYRWGSFRDRFDWKRRQPQPYTVCLSYETLSWLLFTNVNNHNFLYCNTYFLTNRPCPFHISLPLEYILDLFLFLYIHYLNIYNVCEINSVSFLYFVKKKLIKLKMYSETCIRFEALFFFIFF